MHLNPLKCRFEFSVLPKFCQEGLTVIKTVFVTVFLLEENTTVVLVIQTQGSVARCCCKGLEVEHLSPQRAKSDTNLVKLPLQASNMASSVALSCSCAYLRHLHPFTSTKIC